MSDDKTALLDEISRDWFKDFGVDALYRALSRAYDAGAARTESEGTRDEAIAEAYDAGVDAVRDALDVLYRAARAVEWLGPDYVSAHRPDGVIDTPGREFRAALDLAAAVLHPHPSAPASRDGQVETREEAEERWAVSWNYRWYRMPDGTHECHETYYGDNGRPNSRTVDPVSLCGWEDRWSIETEIARVQAALRKPILDPETYREVGPIPSRASPGSVREGTR